MKKNIFWYINILSLEVIVFVVGNYYFICYYLFVRCNMNLLNEFDNNKNAVINPCDFIKKINNMPEVAIACFSSVLFEKIINGSKCIEIGKLHNTNGYKSIYEIEYKGKRLAIFMMAVGAPAAVADIEDIHEMGSKKIIVFGNCGVLDNEIDDCSIIIPNRALRDEGTSFHYMSPSKDILVNKKYISEFEQIINDFGYKYTKGTTWTTDAFYRETRDIINNRRMEGAKVVEMEASALQAVADFRGFDLFIFFYAGDNLAGDNWDKRSLDGEVKLDEKSRIAYLALELGYMISENDKSK